MRSLGDKYCDRDERVRSHIGEIPEDADVDAGIEAEEQRVPRRAASTSKPECERQNAHGDSQDAQCDERRRNAHTKAVEAALAVIG